MNALMKKMVVESEDHAGLICRMGGEFFEGYSEKFSHLLLKKFCEELKEQGKPEQEIKAVETNLKKKIGLNK